MNTNTWMLFSVGVILGILISMSLLQNDLFDRLFSNFPSKQENEQLDIFSKLDHLLHIEKSPLEQTEKPLQEQDRAKVDPPSTSAKNPDVSQFSVPKTPEVTSVTVNPVKWAPGKEMNFDKYIQQAESVQKHVFGEGKVTETNQEEPVNGRRKKGLNKQKRKNDPLATTTRKELSSSIISINRTENPINLENQVKLYKKLKRKEGMFVGDNDEDPTATVISVPAEPTNPRKKGITISTSFSANASSVVVTLTSGNGFPPIPYHQQCLRLPTAPPVIPTYENAMKQRKRLPDMSKQKGNFEKENLKLHLCNGVFEAYSAAYLTTKEHMLAVASESFNLTWVNCEMASFIHMKESNRFYKSPDHHGVVMQSLDVLDFSVIHLSAFERSSLKHKNAIWDNEKDRRQQWSNIDAVITAGKRLEALNHPQKRPKSRQIQYSKEAQATVVVMPFLGGAMGAGHSKLGNRFEYLKTCFWSFYEFFPHIVMSVTRQEDVDWGWKESGLPFYDIILITGLPKSASLPVATTQQTKKRLQSGQWANFSYVFFTESDQILIARELPLLYSHLQKYPGHMMLPHRLMPYSTLAITKAHQREIVSVTENQWMNQSCCLPRQNCIERTTWKSIKDPIVPMINYYGLYVPLGNINFLREEYRYCTLSSYIGEYCP